MRYLLFTLFLLISLSTTAQEADVVRLSEPVIETSEFEIFGTEMDVLQADAAITLTSAISETDQESEIFIQTTVNQVCKKKGCFFIAVDGETSARVTFKDYGFFIPTNSAGKDVVLRGVLTEKTLSEDQARHYAEDAGESSDEIVGEQKEYSIIATSVMIPKAN